MKPSLLDWMLQMKKWSTQLAIGVAALYLTLAINQIFFTEYKPVTVCPVEEHDFGGKKYDIEFCIGGGGDYHQYLDFRVFSKSGELLAARGSTFHKVMRINYMAIENARIQYSDYPMDDSPLKGCVLNMPPTRWDWWEARLPGGLPGVDHCKVIGDEEYWKVSRIWDAQEAERQVQREAAKVQSAQP